MLSVTVYLNKPVQCDLFILSLSPLATAAVTAFLESVKACYAETGNNLVHNVEKEERSLRLILIPFAYCGTGFYSVAKSGFGSTRMFQLMVSV